MNENELAELDLAVALAEGWNIIEKQGKGNSPFVGMTGAGDMFEYRPTRDPAEAMRLLEKYVFDLRHDSVEWYAGHNTREHLVGGYGPTPAIAICRATVALKQRQE